MFTLLGSGYVPRMVELPPPLHDLAADRTLLFRCLDALDESRPAVERADLARVTALLAARYENVLADALYPQIVNSIGTRSEVERAELRLDRARETIGVIRADMRGVKPINAHASDPDGFERDIDIMTRSLRELLQFEVDDLFPLVEQLDPTDVDRLRKGIEAACAHQTSLPDPPHNALVRKLAEMKETVSLSLNDQSTPWHPGIEAVLDPSE
jgi:hypothetical protein